MELAVLTPDASRGPPRFEWVPLFFLPVDKLKSSDRENSTEIHVHEEGARRQEWKKNRVNERRIPEKDTNTDGARLRRTEKVRGMEESEARRRRQRDRKEEVDKFRWSRGRGIESGPNVAVTGNVALPDDISPHNYLSVQRDSVKRLLVLMPADNIPIVS